MRRSYAGAANILALAAPYNVGDPTFVTDSPIGWPDGTAGPIQVRIGKGQPNEQKVLVSSRTGSTFTVQIAGWDGTAAQNHSATETVEIIGSSTDFDEANQHVNTSSGVHGLGSTDRVVGETRAATLTQKTMSGADNTFTNIPRLASPEIDAALTANSTTDTTTTANLAAEIARATAAESVLTTAVAAETSRALTAEGVTTAALSAETTTRAAAITTETAARVAGDALALPLAGGTMTGPVVLPGDATLALQATTKQQMDARDGKWGVTTGTPDGNGNFAVTHGLGATPTTVQLTLVAPSTGNAAAGLAQIRSFDSTVVNVRIFAPAGTPFTGSNVTVHWTVRP